MPVYNTEKYLVKCLDSLINQTFTDIEIICIDDKSKDDSVSILKRYAQKDNRIKVLLNSENVGQGVTRNTGMSQALGKYIFFMDSDDYLKPDTLENMYILAEAKQADWIIGKITPFADTTSDNYQQKRVEALKKYLSFDIPNDIQVNLNNIEDIINLVPVTPANCLYKTEFIRNNNITFINKKCPHEDDGFFIKIVSCLPHLIVYDQLCYFYRVHGTSTTAAMAKNTKSQQQYKKMAMIDALDFVSCKSGSLQKEIKKRIIRNCDYYFGFSFKIPFLLFVKWGTSNKTIKILLVQLFRQKYEYKERKTVIKLFGITVFSRKEK